MIPFAFMKKSVCLLAVCCAACSLAAQVPVWNNPSVGGEGKADSRPEFISYPTREAGETGDPANAPHYVSLAGTMALLLCKDCRWYQELCRLNGTICQLL